ncbi:MAG: hypothetical protein ACRCZW_13250 [Lactobacillaceae bacterium]
MKSALKVEFLKTKFSGYLKIALILPMIFFVFTLMTVLSSQNPTGLVDGVSVIQSNIFNLWSLILLPVGIVIIISSDYQQENKALGLQHTLANNWSLKQRYLAKSLKFWLLVLLSQLVLIPVVLISNLLTTKATGNISLLVCTSLVIWIGSFPLVVINMCLLNYLNTIIVSVLNLILSIGSTFLGITLTSSFWFNPWVYALRAVALLRINPNGTTLAANSFFATDTNFIYLILISVTLWLVANYLLALFSLRKVV